MIFYLRDSTGGNRNTNMYRKFVQVITVGLLGIVLTSEAVGALPSLVPIPKEQAAVLLPVASKHHGNRGHNLGAFGAYDNGRHGHYGHSRSRYGGHGYRGRYYGHFGYRGRHHSHSHRRGHSGVYLYNRLNRAFR